MRSESHPRRRPVSINRSPLARRIVIFNLAALVVLVAGVLYLNPFRDTLVLQRERGLVVEAELIAAVLEARLGATAAPGGGVPGAALGPEAASALAALALPREVEVHLFDAGGALLAVSAGGATPRLPALDGLEEEVRGTLITDLLGALWEGASLLSARGPARAEGPGAVELARGLVPAALAGETVARSEVDAAGATVFRVATPIERGGRTVGALTLTSEAGVIDDLARAEREQVLQMFVLAILVSIGLSLALASTIAGPLSDLAAAAELGRGAAGAAGGAGARRAAARVRIPDLGARPDEIGRLSSALRGMVAALYERVDANEQFAADVAHEIKNPLASLRSAVGTLRLARREDQRERLIGVIEHDVRRLDRLVSDISNASRLDSELVREEEEPFDLVAMVGNLAAYLGEDARARGIDFVTDLPPAPIVIQGLEARLAQVFVNLIGNAVSFCQPGDAIRIWARRRDDRVLVVVEDTGPGVPEAALGRIFDRFYSERPAGQFGDNSGLGLAISKQIVEAHGGVIWAENIRPTEADAASEPLGARFVVGLPV